jgi:signal transduction histidine kinase/CheY-like chemotaxis protein
MALLWEFHSQKSETDWVEHTDRVILLAETAKAEFLLAQNALRDYLISSDSPDHGPLQEHWNKSQDIIKELVALVADNSSQEQRLTNLNGLENQWLIAASAADSAAADSEKRELAQRAAAIGNRVLAQFDAVSETEQGLRIVRDSRRDLQYRIATFVVPFAALILIIGLTTTAWREIRRASRTFAAALKDAEQANQTKTNFLAVVSHELRNPLNSILLWCNALLSSGTLEGRTGQGVAAIFRAAKAQAQLIEDLLDISRIESGHMRFDVQPISPAEIVRAAVESMSPAADAKSIAIQIMIDPRTGAIVGDSHRLQQAVWNLLSNAIKFTPKNGKVQVRLERINSHLEIVVADNGEGIDPRAIDNVFDRFWQGTERPAAERGLGLGLSIVKHIVNLHGGTVTAHSDGPGKGSAFVIRLPVPVTTARLEGPLRRHPTVDSVVHNARVERLEAISALLVDDDPETREAMRSLLTSLGARVTMVENVERAIAALAQMNPDVLISDLGMPGRDGYSLIKEIRAKEKAASAPHLAAIALTAYGRVEDRVEILAAGFDAHVVKPVDTAELAAVIKRMVEAARSDANTPSAS